MRDFASIAKEYAVWGLVLVFLYLLAAGAFLHREGMESAEPAPAEPAPADGADGGSALGPPLQPSSSAGAEGAAGEKAPPKVVAPPSPVDANGAPHGAPDISAILKKVAPPHSPAQA